MWQPKSNLIILEKRREKGDLIGIYRASKGMEKVESYTLPMLDTMIIRGHSKKKWGKQAIEETSKDLPFHTEAYKYMEHMV